MFGKTLLVLSHLLFAVVDIGAEIISFRANKNVLKQGDEAVLMCEFSKPLPFGAKFHMIKFYGNQSHWFDEEEIDRFDLDVEDMDPNVARVKLTIKNVGPGDSGNYSCYLKQDHISTYRFQYLAVEDEPDTIKFFLDDREIVNGSAPVKLRPNDAYRLRCETTGSNPRANFSITYGGLTLVPTNVSNSSAILRNDHVGNLPFLVPIEYNTTATVDRWVFTADALSSALSCSAKVNVYATGISTSFYPEIEDGAPLFACNDTVYAINNQRDFSINCTLYSKPTLSTARFFFDTGKANLSIEGYPWGQERSAADRNYRGIVKVVNDLKFIMILTISSTDTKSNIKFNFEAENNHGRSIHSVTLMDRARASFASPVKSSMTTLMLAAVLVLAFLCHL